MLSYYGKTNVLNVSDSLIFSLLIVDVCNCKSKHTIRNENSLTMTANTTIKKQNNSQSLNPVVSIESIYSYKSKRVNTKNNDNKRDRIPTCIRAIRRWHFQKKCKIITKSDSDKSKKDEISNAIDENIKQKKLGTSNFNIKVYISYLLVLLNLFFLNSTKQKLTLSPVLSMLDLAKYNLQSSPNQTKPKENKYLASFPSGD